jgi:ribosomal-protein-alanine N-acetyltransferase
MDDADEGWVIERLSTEGDLDAVVALETASFSTPWTRENLIRELSQSEVSRVYVMLAPGRSLAAFCACWIILDELHINTIAVEAGSRRKGLATRLLRHVFADALAAGALRATLEVRRSNEAALELYTRLGFTIQGVRPRYYSGPEEDALVLWRDGLGARAEQPGR